MKCTARRDWSPPSGWARALRRWLLAAAAAASPAWAQAPRQDRALTRPENWGLTFGLDGIAADFAPPLDQPYAFRTRGGGLKLNGGVVFLRHVLFGGDVGAVYFGGDRPFASALGTFRAQTTNSIVGSVYTGLITSPMGAGPRAGRIWWAGALLGASKWSGERRLEWCDGCAVDRIRMTSGAFVEPFVVIGGGDRDGGGGFRLAYRQYLVGGRTVRSAVTLGVFFDLLRL